MGVDFIDYTYLQKRGLIKRKEVKNQEGVSLTKDGFVQLSEAEKASVSDNQASSSTFNPFGFLDNASSGNGSSESYYGNSGSGGVSEENKDLEIQGLKNKIEDLEYKLEKLIEKFDFVENKLIKFENRVG